MYEFSPIFLSGAAAAASVHLSFLRLFRSCQYKEALRFSLQGLVLVIRAPAHGQPAGEVALDFQPTLAATTSARSGLLCQCVPTVR